MPIQFQDKQNAFNCLIFDGSIFVTSFQIVYEDILSSTLTLKKDGGELDLKVKFREEFQPLFQPENVTLLQRIVKDKSENESEKIYVLTDSIFNLSNNEQSFQIIGLDLNSIKSKKLIGTTENVIVTDPDNLPDNFYKYKDNSQFDTVIDNLYTRVFKNPQILAFGQLLGLDSNREIVGLDDIIVESQSILTKQLQYSANSTFFDVENEILKLFDLTNRSEFTLNTNKRLDIEILKPKNVEINLISNPEEVESLSYKIVKSSDFSNLFHATANPNVYSTSKNVQPNELTTFEISEDVSFIAGDDQGHTDNQAESGLKTNNKSIDFDLQLKFNILTHFIDYNLNDIVQIKGVNLVSGSFRILEIVENIEVEGVDVIVKLEKI